MKRLQLKNTGTAERTFRAKGFTSDDFRDFQSRLKAIQVEEADTIKAFCPKFSPNTSSSQVQNVICS